MADFVKDLPIISILEDLTKLLSITSQKMLKEATERVKLIATNTQHMQTLKATLPPEKPTEQPELLTKIIEMNKQMLKDNPPR